MLLSIILNGKIDSPYLLNKFYINVPCRLPRNPGPVLQIGYSKTNLEKNSPVSRYPVSWVK